MLEELPKRLIGNIHLGVNVLVPKPYTPWQREPMDDERSLKEKIALLQARRRADAERLPGLHLGPPGGLADLHQQGAAATPPTRSSRRPRRAHRRRLAPLRATDPPGGLPPARRRPAVALPAAWANASRRVLAPEGALAAGARRRREGARRGPGRRALGAARNGLTSSSRIADGARRAAPGAAAPRRARARSAPASPRTPSRSLKPRMPRTMSRASASDERRDGEARRPEDLDVLAAEAEHQERTEARIGGDAEDHLVTAARHLLDEEAGRREAGARARRGFHRLRALGQRRLVAQVDRARRRRSLLCTRPGATALSTTGKPISRAAARAASRRRRGAPAAPPGCRRASRTRKASAGLEVAVGTGAARGSRSTAASSTSKRGGAVLDRPPRQAA